MPDQVAKVLGLGDSTTITTGFGKVNENLFKRWHAAGVQIDLWGIGFKGWNYKKHPYIHTFFPGGGGGEWCQPANLALFLAQLKIGGYTHVFILQDTFLLSPNGFPAALRKICREQRIHSTLYFPVDAPLDPAWTEIIASVDLPVAYTNYGRAEAIAKLAGQKWQRTVRNIQSIPHGVDTSIYQPIDKRSERDRLWNEKWLSPKDFLLINVNQNQRRKDPARSLEILAELKSRGVPAKLIMHMQESSNGMSLEKVSEQLGLQVDQDWTHHDSSFRGCHSTMSENVLVQLYQSADLYLTTTLGEGWGLTITEALACGLPIAVPMHTACEEILADLAERGMRDRMIPMPVEPHGVYLECDNSRWRRRTDVTVAVDRIESYYHSDAWRQRAPLTAEAREWLSWDRIAAEFLRAMGIQAQTPALSIVERPVMEPNVL